jgi:hypothetical protein
MIALATRSTGSRRMAITDGDVTRSSGTMGTTHACGVGARVPVTGA